MAWTNICTKQQLKDEFPALNDAGISDAKLDTNISDAKDVVYDDLSKYVDWDEIEDMSSLPRVINRLARYQAIMLTIAREFGGDDTYFGQGEGTENTMYQYFKSRYDQLRKQIATGDIYILDDSNEELEPDQARSTGPGRII